MRKPKAKSGFEMDVVYSRSIHNFQKGITKYVKRKMNKRFRKMFKQKIRKDEY